MYRQRIEELTKNNDGELVVIVGFVEKIRDQKKMQFVVVNDQTGRAQLVNDKQLKPYLSEKIAKLAVGSTIHAVAKVQINPSSRLSGLDLHIVQLNILSQASKPMPIDDNSSEELQLDWRSISLRNEKNQLMMRVQTSLEEAMREFWSEKKFFEIHSPKLMAAASESGSELFSLEYFGGKAYLAQSPQFYKQLAIAGGLDKVFEIGPVFRANPSFTSRHDTEFTSVDMEIAWISSHEDVMNLEELWLSHVISSVSEKHGEDISRVFGSDIKIPVTPFPRITFDEAQKIVRSKGHHPHKEDDLDPESERILFDWVFNEHSHEFLFVHNWPVSSRPFYHMRYNEKSQITMSFDLIWKGIEITTGAQREHRYDQLVSQALSKGLALEPINTYLQSFKYGCPPHGGCGIGLTRLLMILLGVKSVREVTFLYRGPNRLTP